MPLPIPRIYGSSSSGPVASVLLNLYDPTGVQVDPYSNVATSTGIWRAVQPSDMATTIDSLNISGISIAVDQLEGMTTSGVQFVASLSGAAVTSNGFLSTLSGQALGASTASNDGVSGTFGTVLPANPARKAWFIQNLATGSLAIRYSTSNPTTGNLSLVLKGGTVPNDGIGASFYDDQARYKGAVSVSGLGGVSMLYSVWQL